MESSSFFFTPQLKQFAMKVAIVFLLFAVTLSLLMPDTDALSSSIRKATKDEKTRSLLLSFVQNPAALYRASEVDERGGKLESAVMEMELAIGLLEMHNSNQQVINRYTARLNSLRDKVKNSAESAK